MQTDNIGFIGAGRVVRIILDGLGRAGRGGANIIVSNPIPAAREKLEKLHPGIELTADNKMPAGQKTVFVAVHPPIAGQVLAEISKPGTQEKLGILSTDAQYDPACACSCNQNERWMRGSDGKWIYPVTVPNGGTSVLIEVPVMLMLVKSWHYKNLNLRLRGQRRPRNG